MRSTPEQLEPAIYKYVREAAKQLPFFAEKETRRELDMLLVTSWPLSDLGPDFVEFFGGDTARSLADKIRGLAEQDSSGGRIAKAAIRWADRFDKRIEERAFPRFRSTRSVASLASYPQFVGTTRTQRPDGGISIEYIYR